MSVAIDTALMLGVLTACAVFLILQARFVRMLFGFVLLSHAANLFVVSVTGDPVGGTPPVFDGSSGAMVDPLPQAFVLTAIVINLGVTGYLIVLFYRLFLDRDTTTARRLPEPSEGLAE